MSKHRALSIIPLLLAVDACAPAEGTSGPDLRAHAQPIVGGTPSTAAHDAVVSLNGCTATLIAPNLILTARHCLAEIDGDPQVIECLPFKKAFEPSTITVSVGIDADSREPIAKGKRFFLPERSAFCGFDIAVVELDRDVPGAKTAPIRFSELGKGEPMLAVGYGVDGNDRVPEVRMQRATEVLGVGPTTIRYTTKGGARVNYDVPAGDIAVAESMCYGDSGGPLLDREGRVVGVVSRTMGPDADPDGDHGNGCVDLPVVYASVRSHEALIRAAAKAAGHDLSARDAAPAPTLPGRNPESAKDLENDDDGTEAGAPSRDAQKHSKPTTASPIGGASSGCAASAARRPTGPPVPVFSFFLAACLFLARKRMRPQRFGLPPHADAALRSRSRCASI